MTKKGGGAIGKRSNRGSCRLSGDMPEETTFPDLGESAIGGEKNTAGSREGLKFPSEAATEKRRGFKQ